MENLFQYRNQKWVIAVSGGPDSMVLNSSVYSKITLIQPKMGY